MTIYLDIVLLENILMNILIIYFANYLSKKKSTMYKICISSIIGAVYYVILLLPETRFLNFYLYKIVLSLIMVFVGFKNKDIFDYISNIMFFYISSFIFGGAMYGIYYLVSNNSTIEFYPIKIAMLAVCITILAIKNITYYIHLNSKYSNLIYEIYIYIENRIKRLNVFLDTGNSLKDPITNKPIIVVNLESIKEILPKEIYEIAKSEITDIQNIDNNRIHIIPYISLGNQNGLMLGYRVDTVIIKNKNNEIIKINSVILALNTTNLNCVKNSDGLISMEILEKGGNINEYRKVEIG
ncbi:MAG: hypothetical protein E7311_03530 [Clostridiales bacterium]|nr:hypothetical protein [Clostridiales bacterium]